MPGSGVHSQRHRRIPAQSFRRHHHPADDGAVAFTATNPPFTDVQLGALVTADTDRAAEFVHHNLGEFESADAQLQDTVRTFVNEQSNASRAAARLYTHRKTLLRRLDRADHLLPRPFAECSVTMAVALDVLRWRGQQLGA